MPLPHNPPLSDKKLQKITLSTVLQTCQLFGEEIGEVEEVGKVLPPQGSTVDLGVNNPAIDEDVGISDFPECDEGQVLFPIILFSLVNTALDLGIVT